MLTDMIYLLVAADITLASNENEKVRVDPIGTERQISFKIRDFRSPLQLDCLLI